MSHTPTITQADREAAWPLRPECYTQKDYERWMSGLYDNNNVGINRLAAHRIQSTAELQAKLGAAVAVLSEVDDTLEKLSGALAELDAALFAQEIAVIAQERDNISALISETPYNNSVK